MFSSMLRYVDWLSIVQGVLRQEPINVLCGLPPAKLSGAPHLRRLGQAPDIREEAAEPRRYLRSAQDTAGNQMYSFI